jgi:hypothetical protein
MGLDKAIILNYDIILRCSSSMQDERQDKKAHEINANHAESVAQGGK